LASTVGDNAKSACLTLPVATVKHQCFGKTCRASQFRRI
jgi:hypothetical protein